MKPFCETNHKKKSKTEGSAWKMLNLSHQCTVKWKCPLHLSVHLLNENNIPCCYLPHRAIVQKKHDKTSKGVWGKKYHQSTGIIIKMKVLMLSFSCCQIQKAHSNFILETMLLSLLLVTHSYFLRRQS